MKRNEWFESNNQSVVTSIWCKTRRKQEDSLMFQGATKRTIAMTRTNPTRYTKPQAGAIGLLVRPDQLNVGPAVPRCGINLMPSSLITPSRMVYISSNDEMRTDLPCKEEDKAENRKRGRRMRRYREANVLQGGQKKPVHEMGLLARFASQISTRKCG
jgi:hypothetical protein